MPLKEQDLWISHIRLFVYLTQHGQRQTHARR